MTETNRDPREQARLCLAEAAGHLNSDVPDPQDILWALHDAGVNLLETPELDYVKMSDRDELAASIMGVLVGGYMAVNGIPAAATIADEAVTLADALRERLKR